MCSMQTDSLVKNSIAILSVLEMTQYWRLLRRVAEEFSQGEGRSLVVTTAVITVTWFAWFKVLRYQKNMSPLVMRR